MVPIIVWYVIRFIRYREWCSVLILDLYQNLVLGPPLCGVMLLPSPSHTLTDTMWQVQAKGNYKFRF